MSVNKKKQRSVLGDNPLTQGIFNKTETLSSYEPPTVRDPDGEISKNLESSINKLEPTISNLESSINKLEPTINSLESTLKNQELSINNQESSINSLESTLKNQELSINNQESSINSLESRFLQKGDREAVNLRIPIELNDWLNDLLRNGKRKHGSKIPKEIWVQAALELFRAMPVDWESIGDEDSLGRILKDLESRLNNLDQ
jgi:chromosome segregation ATPase